MTKWTGTLKTEDGASATVELEFIGPPPIEDPPTGVTFPDKANTVWIGTVSYPLAAIDPPTTDKNKPGGRDTDQVIVVTKATTPKRNPYGFEIGIKDGKVVASGPNLPLTIISPSLVLDYILSGHGKGETFVRGAAMGSPVRVTKEAVPPPIVVPPPLDGSSIVGEYYMIGTGKLSQISEKCKSLIIAFFQGTDLVRWNGGMTEANGLIAWRKTPGRDILISLGGQGGTVVLDQVDEGVERINRTQFPADGLDFDNEAFTLTTEQTLAICGATSQRLGRAKADFIVQFVPPGGPGVARTLATAVAVKAAGYRVRFGQQTYETAISDSGLINANGSGAVDKAVAALGQECVLVGIMLGDSHRSWDVASVTRRVTAIKAKYPNILGVYFWESSRTGTKEAATNAGTVLGL